MSKPQDARAATPTMRRALQQLLDGVSGSRKILRHLAAVESGLKRKDKDGEFLFDWPADRLRVVLQQLDSLLDDQPPPGLAALRSRVHVALRTKEKAEELLERSQPVSTFLDNNKLQVTEVNASDFDELAFDWLPP